MPRLKPKSKPKSPFRKDQLVVAWRSLGVSYDISPSGFISKGTRLRGDHLWVREFPDSFIPDDTPSDEIPNEFVGLGAPEPHESHITILERLPADQLIRCTHNIATAPGVLGFEKGRVYQRKGNEFVINKYPECFEDVTDA